MNIKNFSTGEKIFSLFCNKNIKWGNAEKENLNFDELLKTQKQEWINFWKKFGEETIDFHDKVVVDYGCGFGFDSLFLFQRGVKHVYCLEITQERLDQTKELHVKYGYTNASYIDNSNIEELTSKIGANKVDIVICRDVMEHIISPSAAIKTIYEILKPNGVAYIGFSPLYKSPYGSHFSAYCKIPYIHLVFSEKTVLNVFKELYALPSEINSYQEIPGSGLNKLSYFHYQNLLKRYNWKIEKNFVNKLSNKQKLKNVLNVSIFLLPFRVMKELFIVSVYTKLIKM